VAVRPRACPRATLCLGLAAALLAPPARAAGPVPGAVPAVAPKKRALTTAVTVTPGATCLAQPVLVDHIKTWLGSDSLDAGVAIEVRGDETRPDVAAISLRTRDGGLIERTFEAMPPGCSDMHAVIGLGVAMAIDASVLEDLGYDVVDSPEPAAPTPQAVDSEQPPRLRRERRGPEPEPPPRRPNLRAAAAVRGALWLGSLPGLAGGGQLHGELGWVPWLELRLGVLGGYTRQTLGAGTVDIGVVAGRFDACFGVQRRRLRPRLCVGPGIGALQASGRELVASTRGAIPWVAALLALELRITTSRVFSLDVVVDGAVPFLRPVISTRDPDKPGMIGDSVTVAPVGVMFGLGGAFTIR
jgi:hypothetical protein